MREVEGFHGRYGFALFFARIGLVLFLGLYGYGLMETDMVISVAMLILAVMLLSNLLQFVTRVAVVALMVYLLVIDGTFLVPEFYLAILVGITLILTPTSVRWKK